MGEEYRCFVCMEELESEEEFKYSRCASCLSGIVTDWEKTDKTEKREN